MYVEDMSSSPDDEETLQASWSTPHDPLQNRDHPTHAAQAFMAHALAGAAAGMAETAIMYPVDTIKTRLQAAIGVGTVDRTVHMTRQLISSQGVISLYRGLTPAVLGAGPAHALYYAVYEQTKGALGARQPGQRPATVAAAGVAATVVNDAVMVPADVIKQRLQINQGQYKGMLDCIMQTWKLEGLAAFYRSYPVTLFMNIPWVILHFPLYETSKQLMAPEHHGDEGPAVQTVAGGIAGGVAAALTTPFDVVKTRLQTGGEGVSLRSALNAPALMRQIAAEEGLAALWRGLVPRALWHAPAGAICWAVYEAMKRGLGVNVQHSHSIDVLE